MLITMPGWVMTCNHRGDDNMVKIRNLSSLTQAPLSCLFKKHQTAGENVLALTP